MPLLLSVLRKYSFVGPPPAHRCRQEAPARPQLRDQARQVVPSGAGCCLRNKLSELFLGCTLVFSSLSNIVLHMATLQVLLHHVANMVQEINLFKTMLLLIRMTRTGVWPGGHLRHQKLDVRWLVWPSAFCPSPAASFPRLPCSDHSASHS